MELRAAYWQTPLMQLSVVRQQSLFVPQPVERSATQPQVWSPVEQTPVQQSLSTAQLLPSFKQELAGTHCPPTQVSSDEQVNPHAPQSKSSLAVSTHTPPQSVNPGPHETVTVHAVDDETAATPHARAAPTASLRKDEAVD